MITFLIKTFKRDKCCQDLIDSIRKYYDYDILVLSDDNKKKSFNGAETINTEYDIGLSEGRNRLVDRVKTKYCVILDDDFVFTEETKIEKLLEKLEKENLDICAGSIRQPDNSILHYEGIYGYEKNRLEMFKESNDGLYDFVLNFFIAKTDSLKKYRWDSELKLAEHTAFFFQHRGKLRIGYLPEVIVNHKQVKDDEYTKFRMRANYFIYQFMKKYGIVYIKNAHGTVYDIKEYSPYERITEDKKFDGIVRKRHEDRYRWADRFVEKTDKVIDAGCGIGYGKKILKGEYIGLDKNPVDDTMFDLTVDKIDYDYDVFVGLEIIEHLPILANFIEIAKKAKKYIIISAPLIKTAGYNKYHLQDFTEESLKDLFIDGNWELNEEDKQSNYGIFCFKRIS